MKKLVYTLICTLLAAFLTVAVFASENAEMSLDTTQKTVAPGETVAFTVTLGAMEDCASAGFTLSYDETVFEFLDGSCTAENTLISSVKDGTGVFSFGDPAAVSGEIFAFRLKVKDSAAAGSYTVTAKGSVRDEEGAVATKVNGVTVAVGEEATEPATATVSVFDETKPVKDIPLTAPEAPVLTVGAESDDPQGGFPWWVVAVGVAGLLAAGWLLFYKKNEK